MRRLLLIVIILGLFAGGWGEVLAASLCPRGEEEHACCRTEAGPRHDGHAASPHETAGEAETAHDAQEHAPAAFETRPSGAAPESCAHCVSRSTLPVTSGIVTNTPGRAKREAIAAPPASPRAHVAPPHAGRAPVLLRSNAPPGASVHRHLLNSVFLI